MYKKVLFYLFGISLVLSLAACSNNDDDYYVDQGDYYAQNDGAVTYDGITKKIRYMNIFDTGKTTSDGRRIWSIDLSSDYMNGGQNIIRTDVLFQADILVPSNMSLSGNYDMLDLNGRTFNFATYFEGVQISGNEVTSYDFRIRDEDFISGTLSISVYNNNYAEVTVNAIDGYDGHNRPLNLWFKGNIN